MILGQNTQDCVVQMIMEKLKKISLLAILLTTCLGFIACGDAGVDTYKSEKKYDVVCHSGEKETLKLQNATFLPDYSRDGVRAYELNGKTYIIVHASCIVEKK